MKRINLIIYFCLFAGLLSCSKNEESSINFDGIYNGWVYNSATKQSNVVKISIENSSNSQINIKGLEGIKIDLIAQKQIENDCCINYNIISNDTIKGVRLSKDCEQHFAFTKNCKCINFAVLLRQDTLIFSTELKDN